MLGNEGTNGKAAMKPIIHFQTWRIGKPLSLVFASISQFLLYMIMSNIEPLIQESFSLLLETVLISFHLDLLLRLV